jgi:hypothetical protein
LTRDEGTGGLVESGALTGGRVRGPMDVHSLPIMRANLSGACHAHTATVRGTTAPAVLSWRGAGVTQRLKDASAAPFCMLALQPFCQLTNMPFTAAPKRANSEQQTERSLHYDDPMPAVKATSGERRKSRRRSNRGQRCRAQRASRPESGGDMGRGNSGLPSNGNHALHFF